MTVSELMKVLQGEDADMEVVILQPDGYDYKVDTIVKTYVEDGKLRIE